MAPLGRRPGDAACAITFWSADWTPWRALARIAALAGDAVRHKPALRRAVTDAADIATTGPVAQAVSTWEDPPRGEPADGAPVLSIDGFVGPLDWLLEMARAKKIDLARLSIGALIEAFARAMQAALAGRDGSRIGHWAAWTVMAATLTELWRPDISRVALQFPPRIASRRAFGRAVAIP